MEKDRELLFGVLAVQLKLVSPQQLMEIAAVWATNRTKTLSEVLVERGFLSADKRTMIEQLLELEVKEHSGDIHSTLQSFGGDSTVYESFAGSILVEKDEVKLSFQGPVDLSQKPVSEELDDDHRLSVEQPGRYEIKGEHDRGGIGRIMIGVDEFIGRQIAIKELLPEQNPDGTPVSATPISRTASAIARFLREARITGQLEHPGIVPIYEIGKRSDGSFYYTMKFMRGKNLSDKLKECKNLQERLRLLANFISLCQAVAYAHSKKVIHRDLKPANVMIGEFGETILLDWGLAKVKGLEDIRASQISESLRLIKESGVGTTSAGLPIGTPAYMSPEQADGKIEAIDERSDIWGLGVILYEILTGALPYIGDSGYEVIGKILSDPIVHIWEINPKAPRALAAIAEKCLEKAPEKRYQDVATLADEIEKFQAGGLVSAYEYGYLYRFAHWVKMHRRRIITGLAIFVILAVAGPPLGVQIYPYTSNNKMTDEEYTSLLETVEEDRLFALIDRPSQPGNAAAKMMDAIHNPICGLGQCIYPKGPISYPGFNDLALKVWGGGHYKFGAQNPTILEKGGNIQELYTFRAAGQLKDYRMWGEEVFPIFGGELYWKMTSMDYHYFFALTALGMARARALEMEGRVEEAVSWYQDLLRINHQLEHDLDFVQGRAIQQKIEIAGELAELWTKQGDISKAEAWRHYHQYESKRKVLYWDAHAPIFSLGMTDEKYRSMIEDERLFPGVRLSLLYGYSRRCMFIGLKRAFLGPSEDDKKFCYSFKFKDPGLRLMQWATVYDMEKGMAYRNLAILKGIPNFFMSIFKRG